MASHIGAPWFGWLAYIAPHTPRHAPPPHPSSSFNLSGDPNQTPLLCTCGAQMRVISFITERSVVSKILEHLHRTGSDPARAPPRPEPEALAS